jgi:hypothetical protein
MPAGRRPNTDEIILVTDDVRENMTKYQRERAIKKLEIAIDKLIDLQDMGWGDDSVARALELLNEKLARLQS